MAEMPRFQIPECEFFSVCLFLGKLLMIFWPSLVELDIGKWALQLWNTSLHIFVD